LLLVLTVAMGKGTGNHFTVADKSEFVVNGKLAIALVTETHRHKLHDA
jgi:hypothetical protein